MEGVPASTPPHPIGRAARDWSREYEGSGRHRATPCRLRAPVDHVFTVVEQQQHVPIGQTPSHRIRRGLPQRTTQAEHPRRLSRNLLRPSHRSQIDQPDTIGPPLPLTTRELNGGPGLANASRTSQRHKPCPAQHLTHSPQLRSPANQPRQRCRHSRDRPERSKKFAPLTQPAHNASLASRHRLPPRVAPPGPSRGTPPAPQHKVVVQSGRWLGRGSGAVPSVQTLTSARQPRRGSARCGRRPRGRLAGWRSPFSSRPYAATR